MTMPARETRCNSRQGVSTQMKKLIGVATLLCVFSCLTLAQETPKPEVFGGYQFTTMNPSWNASGWNGQANFYITRLVGITGDFSGAYNSGEHFHTYTFGPVVSTHKGRDRKSTRLNSSHSSISYAVFCLKKKKK